MKEILTIFMDYCGSGIYPFLFLLSLVYLFATEKDRKIRLVLLETSAVILLLFFFPLFKMAMDQVEEAGTYYRILWLLPMTVVTAYTGVRLIGRHTRIGLILLAAVCILGGDYVYDNVNVSKAENRYHMPAVVPAICDLIRPAKDEERVWAVFPSELLQYVRQYTSEIQMPYGREMLVASWDHTEHPLYALMEAETIHIDLVAELLDDYGVQYLILNRAKPVKGEPSEYGLEKSGLDKLVSASYRLLGLISYLTAGEKETRAWTIVKGTKAPQAAGKIHSDFEKGFIRAEIVDYETLLECGSFQAAKEKGKVRSEGKDYVMRENDVVLFRFNV